MLKKTCPWCENRIHVSQLGNRPALIRPKWYQLTRDLRVCPYCANPVKLFRKRTPLAMVSNADVCFFPLKAIFDFEWLRTLFTLLQFLCPIALLLAFSTAIPVHLYEEQKRRADDNPTIGLILCSESNNTAAKYSVLEDSQQLFASKYLIELPSEAELQQELERAYVRWLG